MALAAPSLSGLFSAGDLGVIEFSRQSDGTLVAKYKAAGLCKDFTPDLQVLTGTFEGNVFVGRVTLCQDGPSCPEQKSYPFLGIFSDGELNGEVKLDVGCSSPVLAGKRLLIGPATAEDRLAVQKDGNSASLIANKSFSKKKAEEEAEKLVAQGEKKLQSDYRGAAKAFELAISYREDYWKAYEGLGVAELKLGNPPKARENLERAIELSRRARVESSRVADIHYNLACVHTRAGSPKEAVESLRQAIKLGDPQMFVQQIEQDSDLDALRQDADYRRLMSEARLKRKKGP